MNCNKNYTANPDTTYRELKSKPLVSYTNNGSEVVQITPQEVHLSMRVSEYN